MSSSSIRLGIPKELADEIDALVGPRKRSLFVCEAVREKLHQNEQMENIRQLLAQPRHTPDLGRAKKIKQRAR